MILSKEIGQRALGRCYYTPVVTKSVVLDDTMYYEVELEVRMPKGERKKTAFLVRMDKDKIIIRNTEDAERRLKLHIVTRQMKKEMWMIGREFDFWTLSIYFRRRSNQKIQCKNGVLRLPIYLDKEDLDKVIYLTVYPSLICGEEKLVIETDQLKIKEEK